MATEPLLAMAAEPGLDGRLRKLIRMGLAQRAAELARRGGAGEADFVRSMDAFPLDGGSAHANRQHYEAPPDFFQTVLGSHLKYSCCQWETGVEDLGVAEQAMLDLVISRAGLSDGQRILDLGCGWGALSLELARRFPNAEVVALSGARPQREFIEAQAEALGYGNLKVVTSDVAWWEGAGTFDRIVSVEMFEHVRNWKGLMARVRDWIRPGGLLFVHIFCHAEASYFFDDDVTAEHFFTGGMMPAYDLLPKFRGELIERGRWQISGAHYEKTAAAWLRNLDARTTAAGEALALGADPRPVADQLAAWRLFFMITAESFGFDEGRQWMIGHYLFEMPRP
ncbi:MAG: cyclopropane-fatty-acyl-phospholipid synthase [Phenylobacterium sp.]|nr:cyclopropane-fatty-acyl-phospholipid synthase [Phenylobacterium sp.]